MTEWHSITDVVILKKLNEYQVAKMRLIQLMNPVYQINSKMIGRRIMAHAEAVQDLSPDQHESRKHHTSGNTCLCKVFMTDILRQEV